jgi:hypothetical protein
VEDAMNKNLSANEAMFSPQHYKTFLGALESFFTQECPQIAGKKLRDIKKKTVQQVSRETYHSLQAIQTGQPHELEFSY